MDRAWQSKGRVMNRKIICVAALGAGFLTGCGAARPSRYYQLTVPSGDAAQVAARNPYPLTLLLGPLRAAHLYRETHIVYSSRNEAMGTYEYEQWAEPPTEMLTDVLLRALRASGKYRAVDILRSNSHGDFILYGRLYDFKEISGSPLMARVTVDLELREAKTGSTVWTHFYTHDEPVNGKDVAAIAAALDRNSQRGMAEVKSSLDQYFSSRSSN
jgi:cholesterol transport system auxiliary component